MGPAPATDTIDAPDAQDSSDAAPLAGRPRRRLTAVRCAAGVVVVLYAVAALPARSTTSSDFHRRQAEALAEGHLDIRPVPAGLARLADPYDPRANARLRAQEGVQDLAYVDGRLYSAHGLTVPLALLPTQVLFGRSPPNWVMTLLFGWCGFLAGAWLLCRLRRRHVPDVPGWIDPTMVAAFGLCSPVWLLMGVGGGYEAAIAAAFACTMSGAALLVRATEQPDRLRRPSAAAGSLLLALAVGARPTMLAAAVFVVVAAAVVLRRRPSRGVLARDLSALLLPYAGVLAAIAWFNAARFGSVTEFGFGVQLSVWNMPRYPMARPAYVLPNLADYLGAVPQIGRSWPWLSLRPLIGGDRPDVHTAEPIVGILVLAPVIPVGLACLAAGAGSMWRRARPLAVTVATGLLAGVGVLVAVSLPFDTSTMRYAVDATPLLLLVSCLGWSWARREAAHQGGTRTIDVAWVVATGAGIAVAALVQVPR